MMMNNDSENNIRKMLTTFISQENKSKALNRKLSEELNQLIYLREDLGQLKPEQNERSKFLRSELRRIIAERNQYVKETADEVDILIHEYNQERKILRNQFEFAANQFDAREISSNHYTPIFQIYIYKHQLLRLNKCLLKIFRKRLLDEFTSDMFKQRLLRASNLSALTHEKMLISMLEADLVQQNHSKMN